MELTLEHAPLTEYDDEPPEGGPRLCACGCGGPLRDGAKRAFLRGHKAKFDADNVGPDPDPSDEPKPRRRNVSAKLREEMREAFETYLGMIAAAWSIRDPLCGNAALDAVPNIAAKLTPILCKNASFVKYFTGGSSFKEGMDLFLAVLPVLQVIYAHHMAHTISVDNAPTESPNYNAYVA